MEDMKYFKVGKRYVNTLSPIEIRRLIFCNPKRDRLERELNIKYRAAIAILVCGLRNDEVCQLRFDDIYSDRIILRDANTKTDKERTIPIRGTGIYEMVQKIKRRSEFVFTSLNGPMKPATLNSEIRRRAKYVGITKPLTAHVFRYSFATNRSREGGNLRYIQEVLGHKSILTTMGYTMVNLSDVEKEVSDYSVFKRPLTISEKGSKLIDEARKLLDDKKERLITKISDKKVWICLEKAYT